MKIGAIVANLAILVAATPSTAADWSEARHPNDLYISSNEAAPASGWNGQPWYAPLAECSAIFKLDPSDYATSEMFGSMAAQRIAEDRNISFEDAYYIVLPKFEASFNNRAKTMVAAFGAPKVRAQCKALAEQYQNG